MGFFFDTWEKFLRWLPWPVSTVEFKKKILLVDDDADFCLYIKHIAEEQQIGVEKAESTAEAQRKIDSGDFDAYIVDGHLPDGSGFYVVESIRQKKGPVIPIAFLSRIFQDAISFRLLKEKLHVNYVLEKPISIEDVQKLLRDLCYISSLERPVPESFLAEIKEDYRKSIYDKISRLEKSILAVQNNPTYEELEALNVDIHKIAGSAGSYGYPRVGELCKALEDEIAQQIAALPTPPSQAWLATLDEFFTQVKKNFQM